MIPEAFASADDPPFLITHGDQDALVTITQSRSLDETLRKAGADSTLVEFASSGHGGGRFNNPETAASMVEFFNRHL